LLRGPPSSTLFPYTTLFRSSHSASECSSVGAPCSSSETTRTSSSRACSKDSDATSGASLGAVMPPILGAVLHRPGRLPAGDLAARHRRERPAADRDDDLGTVRRLLRITHDLPALQLRDRVAARERRTGGERPQRGAQLVDAAAPGIHRPLQHLAA